MGVQQSKSRHRKPTFIPDSEKDELTKSLSYQSNDEGTSVDTESASLQLEIPTTLSPLTEECTESEPIVMSGLPGETGPTANFYLENTEETKTQTVLKHEFLDEYLKEKDTSKESDCLEDSKLRSQNSKDNFDSPQGFSENSGKKDHHNSDTNQSFESRPPIMLETVDGRLDTARLENNFDLKDNEMANKHYHFPVHFDAKGIFKKKVTTDTKDNRCHCPLSDNAHTEIHKQIFTNVIFLPDKSKGASPKRYGPKRLGSIYDNSAEDAERIDSTAEKLPTAQVLSYSHKKEYFDSKKDQQTSVSDASQAKKLDIDDRPNGDTDTVNEKVQVNDQGVLTFVEDHFGFYTGCLAEGISKEFQGQIHSASTEIGTGLSKSLTLPDNKVEINNNNSENKLPENAISDISGNSKNQESREHVQLKPSNVETGHRRNVNPSKTDEEMCNNTIKGEQKKEEQISEEEAVEICKKCKEPGDLCLCLFPDTKTVMHVKMKAPLSYLRYMTINNKDINWSNLKSAQAVFIKRLKSHKSEISEDNRVVFEFSLPPYKGFFGPDQRESERENCDKDMLEKSTGLVKAIETKFGLQLTGIPLTASIDSNKNIMINDFDVSSDDDDDDDNDDDDDDDDNADADADDDDETDDESDIENHENSYRTKCNFKGKKLTLPEKWNSGQVNFHSEERGSCFRCTNHSFHTENQDPGSSSETNIMHEQEEQSFEEGKCIKSSQAFSFRYSRESFPNKSLSSYEKGFTENGKCNEFDIKSKSDKLLNSFEDIKLYTRAYGDTETLAGAVQLKCTCVTRKDANNCCQCGFKTERKEINEANENGDCESCNRSEIQKLDGGLKEDTIQKDIKKQCQFKRIKTWFEEDNRLKVDEVISDNFKQAQENNNHSTFIACCHANDEVSIQNQLTEDETDENNNVSIYSDTNVGIQSTNVCSSQNFSVVVGTDLELQNFMFETESDCEYSDFSSSSEDTETSECCFEDSGHAFLCSFDNGKIRNEEEEFIGKVQEYDEKNLSNDVVSNEEHKFSGISILQKEPGFIKTENNSICDETGEETDDEKLQSERKGNNFHAEGDTKGEIKQSDRYLEPSSEFHKDCLDSESNENHQNFVERDDKGKCERTGSGKLFEHFKIGCDIDGQQNDKQNKQFVKADTANRKGSKLVKGKVLYEDNPRNFNTAELKNMEGENVKVHLNSILKRKQTKYEIDNRFAQISSDDEREDDCLKAEAAHGTDKKETPKNYKTDKKGEKNIPSFQSFQMGQSSGALIRHFMVEDKGLDFSLPHQDFLKQLQDKRAELFEKLELESDQLLERQVRITGVAKGLGLGNDFQMDFSPPPDELLKQLQEKKALLIGSQEKLQHKVERMENHSRYSMKELFVRPENTKSSFASSFYDNSPQKVDISQLGKDMSGISAALGPDEKMKTGPTGGILKATDGEIRAVQEKVDADVVAMLKSDSSDLSVSSSLSESLINSDDDDSDDYDDDDVPDVKVTDIWIPVIQQEKTKCHQSSSFEENLRCTVLCVDVSASMQGLPWQQVRTFISDFLSGLEAKRHGDNIEEYVAMVTFGYETRIVVQPTKAYGQLADVLDSFNPDGNSPLLPGLALSVLFQTVRRELGRGCCRVSDVTLDHRIILLSDGHPSPSSHVGSSDEFIDELQHQEAFQEVETSLQEWMLSSHQAHVDCVPIGKNPNIDLLETVCIATKGRLVAPSDVEVLVNSTHNHYATAQVAKQMFKMTRGKVDQQMFKALIQSLLPNTTVEDLVIHDYKGQFGLNAYYYRELQSIHLQDHLIHRLQTSEAEMCTVLKTVHKRVRAKQSKAGLDTLGSRSASYFSLEPNNLPKIGTRVCIGEDATEELSKRASGKGTITGHSRKHKGKVYVRWDSGDNTLCCFGYQNKFEVFQDESAECKRIKKGYKVRRGPDWQNGNEDGGGDQLGTVCNVHADGFIRVSWPNGVCRKYRYNHNGAFDVIIVDPSDPFGNKDFEVEMNKRNEEKSQTVIKSPDSVDVSSKEN